MSVRDSHGLVYWIQRLSEIALVGWLVLLLLGDTAIAIAMGQAQFAAPLCGLLGIGAYLLRDRFRVQGMVLLMAMSAGVSLFAGFFGRTGSMRRLVGVLRAGDDASRNAGTTLSDLWVLVERFSAGGPQVAFDVGQGLSESALAPEVLTTLHRVLQESLTNVRRHAPGTGWVRADLRQAERGVLLRVRNYRSPSDPRVARLGGGFGLVGMSERVKALGGDLVAGPTPEGAWEVRAWFPADYEPARL
ncbi:hypothetical protein AB0O34_05390 [Sphaerisporangium sp. NPDC088356]|uniref:sensor histidine kinase n=1 Tax=Sphaerisporangium sp. NPDC088356 TaxID=3154871 RepID=UPI00342DFD14